MNTLVRCLLTKPSMVEQLAKRTLSTSNKLFTFWEEDDKGGYKTKEPYPNFIERMRTGLAELKNEVKLWCGEVKDKFESDPILIYRPYETDVAWRFKNLNSLDNWIVSCDADNNEGYSHCSLIKNNQGNVVFSGNINLRVPKDGRVKRAGYCNMQTKRFRKSFKREDYLNWIGYNTLVMKVRGDGRTYLLNLGTRGYFDVAWNDMYHYQLYTRGGPYWQIAKIPFSKFFMASKGRIQDDQHPIPLNKVSSFGISAQDRHGGEFCLEIDYIALEYDPRHVEEFAYEMYAVDKGIANV
ncbi:complex I intermediate-associated protein 30, mitochondrial [Euwallacea similis]|uniref:complex I intermediate-associated protein 30, mitochondrial n=1 Tax=Euwallacea similis TaxID=1736056 RepID=UPI00345092AF